MAAFALSYLFIAGLAVGAMASFFVATAVRNRLVRMVAEGTNVLANPLATAAAGIRSFSESIRGAVPDTAFADGTVRRLVFAITFFILLAVDIALASPRLSAIFGVEAERLPFDLSWATACGWVITGGLFASISLELRQEDVGHPFDRLSVRWLRPLRILSDCFFVAVLVSGIVFYVLGAMLVAGSAPLILSIVFMGLLGPALIAASGFAFWAGLDSYATVYGVVLVVVSYVVRFVAFLPEMVVISLRRGANLVMATIDLPFLGAAYPLLKWWASSKFGKALGFPPIEEPIPWPLVGYVERPAEALAAPVGGREPLSFPADEPADDDEEAA